MHFDYRLLLAGTWILLFGMSIFEDAIRFLGGSRLKSIIKRYTDTWWKSIFTWFWTTSLLQSSTLLSLLILAFAWAGVLALKSSIGLIFWANIGSPVLPLLVALIGFGEFKISAIALPLIAVGWIMLVFVNSERRQQVSKLLVGFGLLFLGLDFMQEAVAEVQSQLNLETYKDLSLWGFGLLGLIATVVIRSSGAIWIMTLAALSGGIIWFPASIAIGMGTNIGTTFTAVISAFGGSRIKRQIATSHVLFNVLSWIIGVIFFWQYIRLTNVFFGLENNPIMGNAVLMVIFNASTVILFGFFLVPFTRLVELIVPAKKDKVQELKVLQATVGGWHRHDAWFATAKLYALHEDCKLLIDDTATYNAYLFGWEMHEIHAAKKEKRSDIEAVRRDKNKHKEMYMEVKRISDIMLENLLPLKQEKLPRDMRKISEHVEKTIYGTLKSVKATKNIYRDIQNIKESESKVLQEIYDTFHKQTKEFYLHVAHITDREYNEQNFQELKEALKKIEVYHRGFIEMVTKLVNKKVDLEEIDIPSLINVDHYVYQSAKNMVKALQNTYLTEEEETAFEEMEDVRWSEEEQQ